MALATVGYHNYVMSVHALLGIYSLAGAVDGGTNNISSLNSLKSIFQLIIAMFRMFVIPPLKSYLLW